MTLHRFFVPPENLQPDSTFCLEGEVVHQLYRVLRLSPGSQIILLDGIGKEYTVEILEYPSSSKCTGKIIYENPAPNEPHTRITLYQAILKGEKFDYVLQKATEVGVSAFVPVMTERVIGGPRENKFERWRKIVREAAEQSRRGLIPEIYDPVNFKDALTLLRAENLGLFAWENETKQSLFSALSQVTPHSTIGIFIGPEGGFSPKESEQAIEAALKPVSLGPRILRAETAGVVCAAIALYQSGDM